MKISSLSPEQAPPIGLPLRFFLVAPFFLMLAALMLATSNGNPFTSVHSGESIAATHHITLGFMAIIMLGAIQQMLPVVIGSPMPATAWVAWLSLLPLMAGALLLSGGFAFGNPLLLNLSWPLLALAFLVFIAASLFSLARAPTRNETRTAILLSVLSLAGAAAVGILLAKGYASGLALPYAKLAAAHIALALGGWVLLLIIGVSYQVVPMFQLTPNYPKRITSYLSPAIFAILLLNLAVAFIEPAPRWAGIVTEIAFWVLASSFAVVTLRLQSQRRRRVPDATLSFFRLGMYSLLAAALFSLASMAVPAMSETLRALSAQAFLLGLAMSIILGMIYKIVPFLVWFHLFRGGVNTAKAGIPNMKEIIPERWMWRQLWVHGSMLSAVLLAAWLDIAVWLVTLTLLLQGMLLGFAIITGIAVYRRTLRRIEHISP